MTRFATSVAMLLALFPGPSVARAEPGASQRTTLVAPLYEIAEFALGRRLTRRERAIIRRDALARYRHNPQGYQNELQGLAASLPRLRAIRTNPPAVAAMQDELVAAFYFQAQGRPESEVPAVVRLVLAKVPVLAANPATRVVVTQRDLDGFLALNRFYSKLAGLPPSFDRSIVPAIVAAVRQWTMQGHQLAAQFAKMNVAWAAVSWGWKRLPSRQKRALKRAFRRQVRRQIPQPVRRRRGRRRVLSPAELGARLSRNYLFHNIFLQNMNNLANNVPRL